MIRILAIPMAGTVAALLAILALHPERGPARADDGPDDREPTELPGGGALDEPEPGVDEDALPDPEDPEEEGGHGVGPPPEPLELRLRLESDGTLRDIDTGDSFGDVADFVEQFAGDGRVRHRVILSNGPGVPAESLDAALEALKPAFTVRKYYTASEDAPPK